MTERGELIEYLRMEFDRDNDSRDSEAADLLERDGAEIARLRERIAELERGEILTDKELLSAIITGVMSSSQSDRNDALRKVQRHIIRVEQERDELETECEHTSEHRALAEARVVELEDEVARRRAFEQSMRCPQCDTLRLELGEARAALARLPADWSKDSSLATWFPYTAEELTRLRAALAEDAADRLERDGARIAELEIEINRTEYERHTTALERDHLRAENEALRSRIYDIRVIAERGRYDLSALPSDPPQNAVVSEIITAIDAAKERTP